MIERKKDQFDLDVRINETSGDVKPQITSVILCTGGCAETGTFNSWCC